MRPGETIRVIKGVHKGRTALLKGTDGWYYHVEFLTTSGTKADKELVSLHRSVVAPLEGARA